jgi:FSR family fosmidomycin resistance protein-like MFS transporter
MSLDGKNKTTRTVILLTIIFLAIELLDELVDGVGGAAYPLIRTDLHLSYVQVGLLLTIPNTISSLIEPILGILGDLGQRRQLILGGGIAFAFALLLISLSHHFFGLLAAFVLFYPASGSFVSLWQATLMDIEPTHHEQNMARWTLAGSVGNVLGPLALAGAIALNQSWRSVFLILAVLTVLLVGILWKYPSATLTASSQVDQPIQSFNDGICQAINALKRRNVVRWLTLLQFSDLMLDVLRGFLALPNPPQPISSCSFRRATMAKPQRGKLISIGKSIGICSPGVGIIRYRSCLLDSRRWTLVCFNPRLFPVWRDRSTISLAERIVETIARTISECELA